MHGLPVGLLLATLMSVCVAPLQCADDPVSTSSSSGPIKRSLGDICSPAICRYCDGPDCIFTRAGSQGIGCTGSCESCDGFGECVSGGCFGILEKPNQQISCSNGWNCGSTCTVTCDPGYSGPAISGTCSGGSWSRAQMYTTCSETTCGPNPSIAYGVVSYTDGSYHGSTASFSCDTGYWRSGTASVTCSASSANGAWPSYTTSCQLCTQITGCTSTETCTTASNSQCTSCSTGRQLVGGTADSCPQTTCSTSPSAASNGQMTKSDSNYHNSVASFSCNTGYRSTGTSSVTCNAPSANSNWPAASPACTLCTQITGCTSTETCTSASNSQCTSCSTGRRLVGGTADSCPKTTCSAPPSAPSSGTMSTSNSNYHGSVATFACNTGYRSTGTSSVMCNAPSANSIWPTASPSCALCTQITGCTSTETCTSASNSQCTSCSTGRRLVGGTADSCPRTTCTSAPSGHANGGVSFSDGNYHDSVATFSCDTGYARSGTNSVTCSAPSANTAWPSSSPDCVPTACNNPPGAPAGGSVSFSNANKHGSVASFSCGSGYSLTGTTSVTCSAPSSSQQWPASTAACSATACTGTVSPHSKGSVAFSNSNFHNSMATFSCDAGYARSGTSSITCFAPSSNQPWPAYTATCTATTCSPTPAAHAYGSVSRSNGNLHGSVATFSCDSGYYRSGTDMVTCNAPASSTTWPNSSPVCTACTCPSNQYRTSGCAGTSNAVCSACRTCGSGFYETGPCTYSSNRLCTPCDYDCGAGAILIGCAGTSPGACEATGCNNNPIADPDGSVSYSDGSMHASVATFLCNAGFRNTGTPSVTCDAATEVQPWPPSSPSCDATSCSSVPSSHADGSVSFSNGNRHLSVATFTCDTGFKRTGTTTVQCTASSADGVWPPASPECNPTSCFSTPTAPTGGSVSFSDGDSHGSVATFSCDPGFSLPGSSAITCSAPSSDRAWPSDVPTCTATSCNKAPGAPASGSVSFSSGNNHGSAATFSCSNGFALTGTTTVICNAPSASADWPPSSPECTATVCKSPPGAAPNGAVDFSNGNKHGSVASFSCSAGFVNAGDSSVTCSAVSGDSTWPASTRRCDDINECAGGNDCHSDATCANTDGSYTCTCNAGFSGNGVACNANCDAPSVSGAEWSCGAGAAHGDDCTVTEATNFKCSNVGVRTCANGAWSAPSPVCAEQCVLPVVPGGSWPACPEVDGLVESLTECYFASDEGFSCSNSGLRTCTDGVWDQIPSCSGECGVLAVTGGTWQGACTHPVLLVDSGSVCAFVADAGYDCENAGERMCTDSVWDLAVTCSDFDGCLGDPCMSAGDADASCSDSPPPAGVGEHTCTCSPGFAEVDGVCLDVNGCLGSPCSADGDDEATCTDVPAPGTGYTCTCSSGYTETASIVPGEPSCAGNPCGALEAPADGGVGTCGVPIDHGTSCTFECDEGHELAGDDMECQGGEFLSTQMCNPLPCVGAPALVANGIDEENDLCKNMVSGGSCLLSCMSGFKKSGNFECTASAWNAPTCERGAPCALGPGGITECDGIEHGEECPVSCGFGYDSVPHTCDDGVWITGGCQPKEDYCVPIVVGNSPTEACLRDELKVDGTCGPFECDEGYDLVADAPVLTCIPLDADRGEWDFQGPQCIKQEVGQAAVNVEATEESGSGSSILPIFGAVVGVLFCCVIVLVANLLFRAQKKKNRKAANRKKLEAIDDGYGTVQIDVNEDPTIMMIDDLIASGKAKVIGSGGSAVIYKAKIDGQFVAIKKLKATGDSQLAEFHQEIAVMSQIAVADPHSNVLRMLYAAKDCSCVMLELADMGSLKDILQKERYTIKAKCDMLFDVADGFRYLEHLRIAHNDIKPHNILVTSDHQLKISDFGTSVVVSTPLTKNGSFNGTVQYAPVERLQPGAVDLMLADSYSFGVTMWVVLTGEDPYFGVPVNDVVAKKRAREQENWTVPDGVPPAVVAAVGAATSLDVKMRPSFKEWCMALRPSDETCLLEFKPLDETVNLSFDNGQHHSSQGGYPSQGLYNSGAFQSMDAAMLSSPSQGPPPPLDSNYSSQGLPPSLGPPPPTAPPKTSAPPAAPPKPRKPGPPPTPPKSQQGSRY